MYRWQWWWKFSYWKRYWIIRKWFWRFW